MDNIRIGNISLENFDFDNIVANFHKDTIFHRKCLYRKTCDRKFGHR